MRFSFLLACGLACAFVSAQAQVPLTTAGYVQTFDGLGTGLPAGWSVNLSASANSLGTPQLFTTTAASWENTSGSFKNLAAADNAGFVGTETSTVQAAATDRALGVRQASTTGFDPGAAFSFNFSSTGIAVKSIGFTAQMLSVQPRSTTWLLQIGVGANPATWTTIATYGDPGEFGNTTINIPSAVFGTGLNNVANAWIRVVALTASTGSGNRDTFAIDDVTIVTASPPVITAQPVSTTATVGQSASFSVTAAGTGTLTYQWRKGSTAITGNTSATTPILTLPPTTTADAGSYTVVITDENGSTTSAAATLTVLKAPATVTLGGLATTYTGSPQQPTAETNPAGRNVTFAFDGSATAPTNAGTYTVVATITDPDYTGTVTNTFTIAKAPAAITLGGLLQTYDGAPRPVTATTSPAGLNVGVTYNGSTTVPSGIGSYSVAATISEPNYQGGATGTLTILGLPQTITFAPLPARLPTDDPFTLVATASSGLPVTFELAAGGNVANLAGSVVTLTGETGYVAIRALQSGGGNYAAALPVERSFHVVDQIITPAITVSPSPFTGYVGDRFTLTGGATGTPAPALQWFRNGAAIAGATNPTLTVASATLADTGLYVMTAASSAGSATTLPVAVTITKKPQTLTLATPAGALPAGTSIPLGAVSSSGLPVTLTLVSGAGSLVGNQLTGSGGNIVIRATQAGDATYAAVTVDTTYTFVTGGVSPFLTVAPADQTVAAGSEVTFRATAVGTPAPTYQWEKDGAAIAGATNASLALGAVTLAHAGRYAIVATNSVGSARAAATLTVRAAPVIVTPPADVLVAAGVPATFSVTVTGHPAPTYQWRKNGNALAGATLGTFTVASPRNSDEGRYDVIVMNELGAVTSPAATLTVDMKDFTGTYFGRFAGTTGAFVLHVREDGAAALIGHLPGLQTGVATLDVTVDLEGRFTATTTTLAAAPADPASPLSEFSGAPVAAAPQPITVSGTLDDVAGTLAGSIPELRLTLEGTRAARTGPAAAQAGFYRAALLGSADGRGFIAVAPDGQAFVFTASGATLDSGSGRIGTDGRLRLTTSTQATIDLGFTDGVVSGTARTPTGVTGTISGASADLVATQRLVNLSVRSITAPTAQLITGFVIGGTTAKQVLIRAAGPAIGTPPFNVPNVLGNPVIQVLRGNTEMAQNDNWGTPAANGTAVAAAAARAGAFPFRTNSADAALVRTLAPGPYTVMVTGGTGVTLAEIYEVLEEGEPPAARRLVNLSARGVVTGGSPLIAGFVITGNTPQRVLVRGIGPALARAPFNVQGALTDPQLTLFRGGTPMKTSQDWFRDADAALIRNAAATVGAFALGAQSADAAMLIYLAPGAYTALVTVTGNAAETGIALVEVYEVP